MSVHTLIQIRRRTAGGLSGPPCTLLFLDTGASNLGPQRGDDTMAAHAYSGPVAVQEGAPPPATGASRPAVQGAIDATHAHSHDDDAPAPEKDEDDEGALWDTASIYEEILDEVEAFEYSGNGASDHVCTAARFEPCVDPVAQV
jgi:hypothetical protein